MDKLLAIDMDGTCLNSKHIISEETMMALKTCKESGYHIVPTTGRALSCLPHQLVDETFYRYVISSNGAVLSDIVTKENIFEAKLANELVIDLLEKLKDVKLGISIHAHNDFILQGKLLSALGRLSYGKDTRNTVNMRDIISYLKDSKEDVEEVQIFYFSEKAKIEMMKVLDEFPTIVKAYSSNYVELFSPLATKGNALKALVNYLKLDLDNVACIGDSENDLSMFKVAKQAFAMGNAIDDLKEKALYVLKNNDEDGVAQAINDFLLK